MPDANGKFFKNRILALMRNLFPINPPPPNAGRFGIRGPRPLGGRLASQPGDRVVEIRWGRVLAVREALATGRYDLESRLNDLLDDPPAELAALGWS